MTTDGQSYPWIRQEGETTPAYDAFREYLGMGSDRSLARVGEALGKSEPLMERWSAQWGWRDRVLAYDRYMAEAETDGLVHALAETRDKNLQLADKLREHLSSRLDDFIKRRSDPTVAWTGALRALTSLDASVFANVDDKKTEEKLDKVTALLERLEAERTREPVSP